MTEYFSEPDAIIDDLLSHLAVLGVNGFSYAIAANPNSEPKNTFKKLQKRHPQNMSQIRYLLISDEKTRRFRDSYLNFFARNDRSFFEIQVMGPNLWAQPESSRQQLISLLNENQIKSRVKWLLPNRFNKSWVSFFMLHSSLNDTEMKDSLHHNKDKIQRILEVYSEYFASKYIHELNPVYNFDCLKKTSKTILHMAADGMSTQSIADELYLSERGVIYHLDRMKELLDAKNRVQLISRAYQMGMLR